MEDVILIISNDASRTGAPILLLNQLKWLKKNSPLNFVIILKKGGVLVPEYNKVSRVYLWKEIVYLDEHKRPINGLVHKIKKRLISELDNWLLKFFLKRSSGKFNIKLAIVNTYANGSMVSVLKECLSVQILLYVHEGELLIDRYKSNGFAYSDQIIAVSDYVKNILKEKYHVDKKITVIHGAIDTERLFSLEKHNKIQESNIPKGSFVVMVCGYANWHKGVDFFIQIARIVCGINENVHFMWLGVDMDSESYREMKFDIEKLKITDRITLLPNQPSSYSYISDSDIFLTLSRNESFSLVTAEAGLAKKPVLCFEGSGGPCEIMGFDERTIVSYGNVNQMSKRVLELINNDEERRQIGEYLYERVIRNYNIEKSSSKLLELISDLTNE